MATKLGVKAYARRRGVSPAAVRKALERLGIARDADGLVDVAEADAAWPPDELRRGEPGGGASSPLGGTSAGGTGSISYAEARRRKELALAEIREHEIQVKRGEVVPTSVVQSQWFATLRLLRNRLLNVPDRLADELAAETDTAAVHALLTRAIREALTQAADELATAKPEGAGAEAGTPA